MALIDVSELLTDPDFVEDITVIRRSYSIDDYGKNVLTETTMVIQANVQAGAGQILKRLPDYAQLTDNIQIYCKTNLEAQSPNGYADIVVWQGKRYNVIVPSDYLNYGEGYNMAVATLEPVNNG